MATIRRWYAHARAWICARMCDGYDRRAGRIVDAALAARDAAESEIARLRAELARMTAGEPPA